jgi:hypothetical protein
MMTITGIMRSATSLAAKTANQSGISMGDSMVIPYGDLTEEYEDLALAVPLTRAVFNGDPFDAERVFSDYVYSRERKHQDARGSLPNRTGWGFKSPLLLLYWEEWVKATSGISNVVVMTSRCLRESMESLKRASRFTSGQFRDRLISRCRSVERDLFAARKDIVGDADYVITYDDLRADAAGSMAGAIRAAGGE